MKIKIKDTEHSINEDYSHLDDYHVVSVFSQVCDIIDSNRIACFSVFFSYLDSRFDDLTFAYDFESVAIDLVTFEEYLTKKEGSFQLHFYELDRKVLFKIRHDIVYFNISDTFEGNIFADGEIEYNNLCKMIKDLNVKFHDLLKVYFPKAFKFFKKENYLLKFY